MKEMESAITLVCMPWAPLQIPAMGLGLLKAGLARAAIPARVRHLNLVWYDILNEWYHAAPRTYPIERLIQFGTRAGVLPGECIFGAYYHGRNSLETRQRLEALFRDDAVRQGEDDLAKEFCQLIDLIPKFEERCLQCLDIGTIRILGLAYTFCQLLPNLLLARRIKELRPDTIVVMGGAACGGAGAESLMRKYKEIDYIFTGEAEISFPQFARQILDNGEAEIMPGLIKRNGAELQVGPNPEPIPNLDDTPFPDLDDYYAEVRKRKMPDGMPPFLLMETSRGCWWAAQDRCVFCGAHREIQKGYRRKSASRLVAEFQYLAERHPSTRTAFTDTTLWPEYYGTAFREMALIQPAMKFSGEIRPTLSMRQARQLKEAHFAVAQPGIESFSSDHLRLMHKGTTGIQNVACLRYLREAGIEAKWILLYGFPREKPESFAGNLETLRCITHLAPPVSVQPIRLGRKSPAFDNMRTMGYMDPRPSACYEFMHHISGYELEALSSGFSFEYEDDRDVASYVKPVKEFVKEWKAHPKPGALLYVATQPDRGRIEDTRFNAAAREMELDAAQNEIYRACREPRAIADIIAALTDRGDRAQSNEATIREALAGFCERRWMLAEDDVYLSLALMP